jgi:hypothetical protein
MKIVLTCLFIVLCVSASSEVRDNVPKIIHPPQFIQRITYKLPKQYEALMKLECAIHEVPLWLACRLVEYESRWNKDQVTKNKDGTYDIGLFQFNSECYSDLGNVYGVPKFSPRNAYQSISMGVLHLSMLYNATGNWSYAIAGYQLGLVRSIAWRGRWPKSTLNEIKFILVDGRIKL